jgi:hypothetical protein
MSGEQVSWPLCEGLTFELAGQTIVDSTAGVWDLMSVLPDGLPVLDGLVSLETFRDRLVTLDLAAGELVLETSETFHARVSAMQQCLCVSLPDTTEANSPCYSTGAYGTTKRLGSCWIAATWTRP